MPSKDLSQTLKQAILDVYQYRCAISKVLFDDSVGGLHIDHIIPSVLGGTDEITNLIPVCANINITKGGNRYDKQTESYLLDIAKQRAIKVQKRYEQLAHKKLTNLSANFDTGSMMLALAPIKDKRSFWYNADHIIYLLREYYARGWSALRKIADELGTSFRSVQAKLSKYNLYDKNYRGVTR